MRVISLFEGQSNWFTQVSVKLIIGTDPSPIFAKMEKLHGIEIKRQPFSTFPPTRRLAEFISIIATHWTRPRIKVAVKPDTRKEMVCFKAKGNKILTVIQLEYSAGPVSVTEYCPIGE